ncbi:MAG: hypothetical protein AAF552_04065 [Pseudomonadota bacterium]
MKPDKAIFLALLGGCTLLAAAIVSVVLGVGQGIRPAPAMSAAGVAAGGDDSQGEFQLPAFDTYAEVINRPLFNEDRRPMVSTEEPGTGDTTEVPEEPKVELNVAVTGIIITPETQLAMVTNNVTKEMLRMKVGMALDGDQSSWTLTGIEPRRLVFSGGSQGTAEVKLETFTQALKGGAAPPPRRNVVTPNKPKTEEGAASATNRSQADSDSDRAARAEEIRRRVAERRAQLREEAERRRAEAGMEAESDEDDD